MNFNPSSFTYDLQSRLKEQKIDEIEVEGIGGPNTYMIKVNYGDRSRLMTENFEDRNEFESFYKEVITQLDQDYDLRDKGINYERLTDSIDKENLEKPWKW